MNSRFDYVKYDARSQRDQALLKAVFQDVEGMIDATLSPGKQKNDALKALEEAYMWCGKDIRDQQIIRNGSASLQEERSNTSACYLCGETDRHRNDCIKNKAVCNCEADTKLGFAHRESCPQYHPKSGAV